MDLTEHSGQVHEHDEQVEIVSTRLRRRHDEQVTMMIEIWVIGERMRMMEGRKRGEDGV